MVTRIAVLWPFCSNTAPASKMHAGMRNAATDASQNGGGEPAVAAESDDLRMVASVDGVSDDTIVERLRASGIDIARRTVAKYREAMRIPYSVQRRRDKQSMLGNALSAPAASTDRSRDTAPA